MNLGIIPTLAALGLYPLRPARAISRGPLVAAVGTSFEDGAARDIQPPAATPSRAFMSDGWLAWLRILSYQKINLPAEYVLGASGAAWNTPVTGITLQIAAACALSPRPDYCIVGGEPNDLSRTYEEVKADWVAGIRRLQNAGIVPVVCTTIPRGTASLTAPQMGVLIRMNNFKREYVQSNGPIMLIDPWNYMVDQTSITSNALTGMIKTSDNLHPATIGAFWWGKAAAEAFERFLPSNGSDFLAAADYYHATNNPTGNLLFSGTANYGMVIGTGGTQTANAGLTHVGSTATGATAVRSGTSTCTWTHSKENPRTDRIGGERQVEVIAAASGGAADEVYNTRWTPTFANFTTGDEVYAECSIEVHQAPARGTALELYLLQSRPTNSYTAADGLFPSSIAGFLPAVTWKGVFRTPPIVMQSDATAMQLNVRSRLDATAGAASIGYKIGDVQLRKVADRS